ncbi:nitrous oxide-stimulated promoter family protein [Thioalkalivibrio paradoxus]|uniref:Nitrous oxide-stimulated promoter n=1 Tax=Thioalkalivibrio paradoxus ARh 1 TaxID=713585 RepID=W0DMD0_9GAMM|nr:nitrous oxide-stimulated promoter family protein [Thioalkalivibrio paradoxus]AHE99611.1 Nitrous oxide-stimulated promoter [Thioalkalivibrio paradoxus ARh 1]
MTGELPSTPRLQREYRTIESMLRIWCADRHGAVGRSDGLCAECQELLAYAGRRLAKCPYGEQKPTCAKCPVHCYKRAQREQVRQVMCYAGPRMLWRHPWQALLHMLDKLRRVEHPLARRRRKHRSGH